MENKFYERFLILFTLAVVIFTSAIAVYSLTEKEIEFVVTGNQLIGQIPLRIDALSGWMILIINFTILTGILYGTGYLKHYNENKANLIFHRFCLAFLHITMLLVCTVQNFIAFLIVWELMTVSAFILVIFEYWKSETIKAGINYFIQSHIGVLLIIIAFIWVIAQTGSTDFNAIHDFSKQLSGTLSITLFIILFVGFGFKAGFVPLHTWLPYAHPAAPSHVSGIMSGVIIKLGIYGILRTLLLINSEYLAIGEFVLIVSIITSLYGVMLAIVQHNLKKLLAYHSIENIGIIGIGIGLGSIGLGLKNNTLAIAGFAGGLLHILNHSLFKSLLFYGAGSVYQKTGTLNIEKLGGLIKKMPKTAILFLIPALAICGLPPFNGFISEFLIYSGLFKGLQTQSFAFSLFIITAIFALVLTGGLAFLCFTKAFGIVFLGNPRSRYPEEPDEISFGMLLPKYLISALIIAIGLFPKYFLQLLKSPVALFIPDINNSASGYFTAQTDLLSNIGFAGFIFLGITIAVYSAKIYFEKKKATSVSPTWGCGYIAPDSKMQYTASSFVKPYSNLVEPLLILHKSDVVIDEVFPGKKEYSSHTYDKLEFYLIDKVLKNIKKLLSKLNFLQNGRLQMYILYGLIFILFIILFSYAEYLIQLISNFISPE